MVTLHMSLGVVLGVSMVLTGLVCLLVDFLVSGVMLGRDPSARAGLFIVVMMSGLPVAVLGLVSQAMGWER